MKFIALIEEYAIINGFNVKPGFGMFTEEEGGIAFSSGWCQPLDAGANASEIFMYHFCNGAWEGSWESVHEEQQKFLQRNYEFHKELAYQEAAEEASRIPQTRLAPSLGFTLRDSWSKEYWEPQGGGIFYVTSDDGSTEKFEVLTKKKWRRLIEVNDRRLQEEEEGDDE